jgi:hypothetical protein
MSSRVLGEKHFELNSHTGNVLAVVSDKRLANNEPDVVSASDFYPFGMIMNGRSYKSDAYRYGFQNHEKIDEVKGSGNWYAFGDYGYDPRVVFRWNRDPVTYPWQSPYVINNNNPIIFTDPLGLSVCYGCEWQDFK